MPRMTAAELERFLHDEFPQVDEHRFRLHFKKPDAVYVALPGKHSEHISRVLARLEKFAVDVRIVPDFSPRLR